MSNNDTTPNQSLGTEVDHERIRKLKLQDDIDRVNEWINTAIENGLFDIHIKEDTAKTISENKNKENTDENKSKEKEDILNNLKNAKENLKSGNISEGERCLSLAMSGYSKSLYSAPFWWRLKNVYAIHIWIYLMILLAIVFSIFFFDSHLKILTVYPIDWKFRKPQLAQEHGES